ncbi:MAG: hypothetical protein QM757_44710 [Paludibaculum sp.]
MMFHILQKDACRLWWAVLATWVPLIVLSWLDCWRTDWLLSAPEGWLNLLLPLAWACLAAMVVHEEPLADKDHFWRAWPYSWAELLAAKILFVALFIHLPALAANTAVLIWHGFQPWSSMPALLGKQLAIAAVVTGPSMALASVCRRMTHFLSVSILLFSVVALLVAFSQPASPWTAPDETRSALPTAVAALAAVLVILRQYRRRRTTSSRIIGAVASAAAVLLYLSLTPSMTARLRTSLRTGQPAISLRISEQQPETPTLLRNGRADSSWVSVALPVSIATPPTEKDLLFERPRIEFSDAEGQSARSVLPSPGKSPSESEFLAGFYTDERRQHWLGLSLRRKLMDRFAGRRVTIRGQAEVNFVRRGETNWMPVGGKKAVPSLGQCMAEQLPGESIHREGMLKVVCESTSAVSPLTEARLWNPATGQSWRHHLGDAAPLVPGPRWSWLSPLHRLQTYFQLATGTAASMPGNGWMVPPDALLGAQVGISAASISGSASLQFEMRDIALSQFVASHR